MPVHSTEDETQHDMVTNCAASRLWGVGGGEHLSGATVAVCCHSRPRTSCACVQEERGKKRPRFDHALDICGGAFLDALACPDFIILGVRMPLRTESEVPDSLPATADSPHMMPPLGERGTTTLGVVQRPIFATDESHRVSRAQPAPPAGPPPSSASSSFPSPGRTPQGLADALEKMRLPGISTQGVGAGGAPLGPAALACLAINPSRDVVEASLSVNNEGHASADRRLDSVARHAAQPSTLAALAESQHAERPERANLDGLKPSSPAFSMGRECNCAEPRLSNEIELAARKAQRVAEVRTIAQEVARVAENDGHTGTDDVEKSEIEQ